MLLKKTKIDDVIIIEPEVFNDKRGYFFESFNLKRFEKEVQPIKFVQDNESNSSKGVLRGLHFQKPPFEQAKLIRCIEGSVLDVVVDLRKESRSYGQHISIELTAKNKKQLFIPRGFAHGFIVLSNFATFVYKVDNFYSLDHESGIRWNDKDLNISWGMEEKEVLVSSKDAKLPLFSEIDSPF